MELKVEDVGKNQMIPGRQNLKTPTCLPETGQEGAMHSGWIVPDGVLPTKEDARWVLDHVVALARVAGDVSSLPPGNQIS